MRGSTRPACSCSGPADPKRKRSSASATSTSTPAASATARSSTPPTASSDGTWAFEDADCAYLLLNELLYAEETSKVGRFLIEDFKQYLAGRNPDGRQVLLIIDEFSAIADGERTARMVEVVRSYGAAVVLAPQSVDGMGGPEAASRILNAAHTIFLHAVADPDPIIKAAGTKMATEWSLQHERGLSTDVGSTRT